MVDVKSIEIVCKNVEEYDGRIHSLASHMPMMEESEFNALVNSIAEVGQIEPIFEYRGLVLDGRNRLNALRKLGIGSVLVQKLPHKTSKEELILLVNAKEARRKQSKMQLAISGYHIWMKTGDRQDDVARRIGVSAESIRKVKEMVSKLGMSQEVLNSLHNGNPFMLDASKGITTTKLDSVYNHYVRSSKQTHLVPKPSESEPMKQEDYAMKQAILMMLQGKDKKLLISIQNALLEMINN